MNIFEDFWITTQTERGESCIEVPYKVSQFAVWMAEEGYTLSTINRYIAHLEKLDKFVVTTFMPIDDIYEDLNKAFEKKDMRRLRELCNHYEMFLNNYISTLRETMDEDIKINAIYDDLVKYRSAWRKYSLFLCSYLEDKIDNGVMVNDCTIPYKIEFIEYIQKVSDATVSTANSYISRLRSMNDKYLHNIPTISIPFYIYDLNYLNEPSEIIDNLSTSIKYIEDNIVKTKESKTIHKLKSYAFVAKLYREFLKQKFQIN